MSKLPSFQFYPSDWLTDPALRSVSAEARGLWVDILCLMFNGERRGYLQINGLAPTVEQIARMCNATPEEVRRGFNELDKAAVFSKSADNVIFSRRMVKDEKIRRTRRVIGKLGGNPNFSAGKRNPYYEAKDKQNDNQGDYQKITPSSSSSSSSSYRDKEIPLSRDKEKMPRPLVSKKLDTPEFWEAWDAWVGHWAEKRRPLTGAQMEEHIRQLAHEESAEKAVETLRHSIQVSTKPMLFKKWAEKQQGDKKPNQQAQRIRAEDYKEGF